MFKNLADTAKTLNFRENNVYIPSILLVIQLVNNLVMMFGKFFPTKPTWKGLNRFAVLSMLTIDIFSGSETFSTVVTYLERKGKNTPI